MKHIMVDLETLGNGSNAVILSIGAVEFDETGLGSTFYTNVDPQSCVDIGMQIDVGTIMWWMKQGDDARKTLQAPGAPVRVALQEFNNWIMPLAGGDVEVWGNGATFDNVILSNAYRLAGIKRPWSYRGDRCYRTMVAMYPQIKQDSIGVAHNALDDAIYQALRMSKILAHIKGASNAEVIQEGA